MLAFRPRRLVPGAVHAARRQMRCYSEDSMKYCVDLVKEKDYCGYLSCLLFPAEQRNSAFSILAFNQEMLSIRKQCNNNSIAGRMRFQWWRGILDDIYADVGGGGNAREDGRIGEALTQHPVVDMLKGSVRQNSLTKRWLERIIETRQAALDSHRPTSMSDLEDLAESSDSAVLYLHNELLQVEGEDASYAASHFGVCKGLVRLLQGAFTTEFEEPGYIFPSEVMLKHGLSEDNLYNLSEGFDNALVDTVHDIASQAYAHLEKGRELQQKCSAPVYPYLPVVWDVLYLEKLKNNNFDVIKTNEQVEAHTFTVNLQLRLILARYRSSV